MPNYPLGVHYIFDKCIFVISYYNCFLTKQELQNEMFIWVTHITHSPSQNSHMLFFGIKYNHKSFKMGYKSYIFSYLSLETFLAMR